MKCERCKLFEGVASAFICRGKSDERFPIGEVLCDSCIIIKKADRLREKILSDAWREAGIKELKREVEEAKKYLEENEGKLP